MRASSRKEDCARRSGESRGETATEPSVGEYHVEQILGGQVKVVEVQERAGRTQVLVRSDMHTVACGRARGGASKRRAEAGKCRSRAGRGDPVVGRAGTRFGSDTEVGGSGEERVGEHGAAGSADLLSRVGHIERGGGSTARRAPGSGE
ncbi:hypothetical protein AMAG_17884 [Allomyces macrogynus ATCC 38327]|uniref:Uncharacterized protein n=1 Tax=Allomyces macrogynus (strain ATCC 38327) TaxID=578462 RepID=A0A0L0S1F0_ALLM3|nr:hypothetical protein AMAG_17884 [Allomyces macrogynus ATCC 38327]|eukprot:KNE56235.1 hypothetical protein AMAG_17884 [Allomyces macrogynus ATCC 38327]